MTTGHQVVVLNVGAVVVAVVLFAVAKVVKKIVIILLGLVSSYGAFGIS